MLSGCINPLNPGTVPQNLWSITKISSGCLRQRVTPVNQVWTPPLQDFSCGPNSIAPDSPTLGIGRKTISPAKKLRCNCCSLNLFLPRFPVKPRLPSVNRMTSVCRVQIRTISRFLSVRTTSFSHSTHVTTFPHLVSLTQASPPLPSTTCLHAARHISPCMATPCLMSQS